MEQIPTPKKERKFLKAIVRVAGVLVQELALGLGRKYIGKMINKIKIPKKKETLSFLLLLSCTFAFAQYPATGNKQRLGYQTTGDGLVFRGRSNDTTALKPSTLNNAYHLFDTVNNVLFSYIKTKGGWQFNNADTVIVNNNFSQPVDSLFFKTSVSPNNVDTAKMRWDSELGTVVLGMYDQVPNELGFKNFWLVKNQTGSTITKGSIVYANGTVGASGRITVAKFIANGTIDAKYLLGITAHDLSNGEDGYVISFGKIRQVNTDTFADGAILYPSPTTAGVWTDVEPVAPNIDMPIGFCINSSLNNGTIAIRVASGYSLNELHNVAISSPVEKSSLYYTGGLWRDTTAALLVSDTASMLTNYLRTGVAAATYQTKLTNPITGNGSNLYFPIFTSSSNITQSLLRWDGTTIPNAKFISDYNFNEFNGTLLATGATTLSNLAGTGTRMVVASSTGLLSTQTIGSSVTSFSAGTTGLTPNTASTGVVTLGGTLALTNGGTGATSASAARTALGATVRGANVFTLPDIDQVSFIRYNANNTVSQRTAEGIRLDLGGTTIGQSMFMLTNPSAVTFPRFNADNTVTALDAASFRTAIGAGTGTGTVTSVTGSLPISSSGGTTPNITIANAAVSTTGVVTASTQTFGGAKTFNGVLNASSDLNVTGLSALTGGATIGTMALNSSLTHVIGVNSSNAIGEIGVGDGIKFSAGFLGLDAYKTIALMDFPNTSAQSSSDLTSTVTGAVAGSPVLLGVPNASVVANTSYSAWVSSTNTVTVRFNNYSSSSANPASGSFYLIVLNL
jgi:hypothetical protein